MLLNKEILNTIVSLKNKLENEPDGRYSVYEYFNNGNIEFAIDTSGPHYIKNKKTGNYVTEGVIENNIYTGKRKIVWTEKLAANDEFSPANTQGLLNILEAGECICLLKDVSTNLNELETTCFIPDKYVTIPEGYIGMIKPASKDHPGLVIVVPKLV